MFSTSTWDWSMCGKQPSNVAIVADLAPSAWALGTWKSFWKVGGLTTSGSADGLRQWTFLTVQKFWFPKEIWNEVSASDFALWLKHEAVDKRKCFLCAKLYIWERMGFDRSGGQLITAVGRYWLRDFRMHQLRLYCRWLNNELAFVHIRGWCV